jgi:hypothetical protein
MNIITLNIRDYLIYFPTIIDSKDTTILFPIYIQLLDNDRDLFFVFQISYTRINVQKDSRHMLHSSIYNLNQLVHSNRYIYYLFAKCFVEE